MAQPERIQQWLQSDFLPSTDAPVDHRIAAALEYLAYHTGQIDQSLKFIADNIEPGDDIKGPGIRQTLFDLKTKTAEIAHFLGRQVR